MEPEGEGASSQWELSKENIQPLKHGRQANVLSMALDEGALQKLNAVRHQFEEELRMYTGDDPLDVWHRYVLWVEQNYPRGGKEGNLRQLIGKALQAIHSNEQYKSDVRLLELWVKCADLSPNSLEVYQTLEANEICTGLADLYINWSYEYEKAGNYLRADAIYQKGIQAGAQPHSTLQEAHKKFQARVARLTIEGQAESLAEGDAEPRRVALVALKGRGQKKQVPIERVGSAVAGPAGRLPQQQTRSNASAPVFSIFQDTTQEQAVQPSRGGVLPVGDKHNQENIQNPGQWNTRTKSRHKKHVVPVEDLDKYQQPSFSIHADQNVPEQSTAPVVHPHTSNVLAVHKGDFNDWQVPLFIQEPFNPMVQPQYPKSMVYRGTEEFSLEELMAARYYKKKKENEEKRKKEDEMNHMKEMLKKQEEMIQLMLQQQHQKNINRVPQISLTSPTSPDVKRRKSSIKQTANSSHYQDSWVTVNKSVNASNVSNIFDESATVGLLHCHPASASLNSKESSLTKEATAASGNSSRSQENISLSTSSGMCSRGLNLSDPTVNTKMAMKEINDIWSTSLFKTEEQPPPAPQPASASEHPQPASASEQPQPQFSIFQDMGAGEQHTEQNASAPFQIYTDAMLETQSRSSQPLPVSHQSVEAEPQEADMDDAEVQDENCPPPHYRQHRQPRQCSGVLQPALGIPVLPLEQQQQQQEEEDVKDELDDVVPLDGLSLADFTLKMPTNLEAFTNDAKLCSTPAPWSMGGAPQASVGEDCTMAIMKARNHAPLIEENESGEKEENSGELMPPPSCTPAASPAAPTTTTTTTSPPSCKQGLSPIMEASRELRSSSSSSSGYSHCTTLGGQSVHGLTQPTNVSTSSQACRSRQNSHTMPEFGFEVGVSGHTGDFTKSGYLADKSRGESLADSRPCITASQNVDQKEENVFEQLTAPMMEVMNNLLQEVAGQHKGGDVTMPAEAEVSTTNTKKQPVSVDPFAHEVLEKILCGLQEPVASLGGYVAMQGNVPTLRVNSQVTLGSEMFHVRCKRGEGAYAVVYQAATMDPLNVTILPSLESDDEDDEMQVALKVQKPACLWEFYLCHELRQRLKQQCRPEPILDSFMRLNRGYFYQNGSILANQYHKYGTLLDVVNGYKKRGETFPESLSMYFIVELLTIVEALHSCSIIHTDIKPDNLLLRDVPCIDCSAECSQELFAGGPTALKLIDFGRSIDMNKFPSGTTFTEVVKTKNFTCCEMRDGRPWTYQTDLYGIAAVAYLCLCGAYMDVDKSATGLWEAKALKLQRNWNAELWRDLFKTLLNVPSCAEIPSLAQLRHRMVEAFWKGKMYSDFKFKTSMLVSILSKK